MQKTYIVNSLEIIRPTTYNKVTYEHIYVDASKEVRENTGDKQPGILYLLSQFY
ncbi:MAG: hypothetical protein IJF57_01790 [Clostridia bacterium]|nr:hypothetical protein [Clostridia bacterium]